MLLMHGANMKHLIYIREVPVSALSSVTPVNNGLRVVYWSSLRRVHPISFLLLSFLSLCLFHGAAISFTCKSRNSPRCSELDDSLPHYLRSASDPYPKPDKSSYIWKPHFFKIYFNIILTFQAFSFLQTYHVKIFPGTILYFKPHKGYSLFE